MAAEVQQLVSGRIVRMVELLREAGQGIRRVQGGSVRMLKLRGQEGACMTVPHTLQVRCCKLE